jgi:hypothetical protein
MSDRRWPSAPPFPDDMPVVELPMSVRARNSLWHCRYNGTGEEDDLGRGRVVLVGDARRLTDNELLRMPNVGRVCISELRALVPFEVDPPPPVVELDLDQRIAHFARTDAHFAIAYALLQIAARLR